MSWPMHNTGQWNSGMMMGPDVNMGSYTPEQWAVMQQQNWQQWSQWQQQYAQWQSQYGEKYAEQMQAIQAMGSLPPLPPSNPIAPPAPPPPEKPPPPPHENNQPLYSNTTLHPAPVPAPNVVQKQNASTGNPIPTISQTDNSFNRSIPPVSNPSSVNAEALKNLAEEERLFDIQFQKWEEEIQKWKKENANHPDKETYKQYEQRFEACRAQLLVRRQQMDKKKARLLETGHSPLPPQPDNTTIASKVNPAPTIPLQNTHFDYFSNKQQGFGNNAIPNLNKTTPHYGNDSQNLLPQNNQYQEHNLPQNQNTYNRMNKACLESERPYQYTHSEERSKDNFTALPNNPSFLLASESNKKGIPGLDLIPETEKPPMNLKPDASVIDITDDNISGGPDYTKISKGINNILGDEKIMNILSMVRGQGAPATVNNIPPVQQTQNRQYMANNQGNTGYDRSGINQNYSNQNFNNRQNNNNNSPQPFQMYPNQQRHPSPQVNMPPNPQPLMNLNQQGSRQFKADELQNEQYQYNNSTENVQYGDNNRGPSFDKGYPPNRFNMTGPRPPNRPPFQDMPTQNEYSRNVASGQHNTNEFSRGATFPQQNATDYPRRPLPPQNDFARGPPGVDQQIGHDFPRGTPGHVGIGGPIDRSPLIQNNTDPVANKPVEPKWAFEPMFSPSLIVEYEHMPLRLKARDFMEPVHIFEYNNKSKDSDDKKKEFDREEEMFLRKNRRPEVVQDYSSDRYNRDYHSRDFERRPPRDEFDQTRARGPPREDYDDRRRPDENRRKLDDDRRRIDDDRRRIDSRFDDRRRDDREKFTRRDDIPREYDRDFHRDRDRGRRDDARREDSRRDDGRRDDGRRDDHRRDDSRFRSRSRDRDSRKRALSRDSDTSSKKSKDNKDLVIPAKEFEQPKHIVMIDDLLEMPGREMRPEKIVIILRGAPGSGKSYLAKLIRDKEAEYGGTVRIMSIDDYFMQEGEVEEIDPGTGKMIKKPTLKYEYDESSEQDYLNSLKRAFKRCLTDGYFTFIIYDAINDTLKSYGDIWNFARQNDFQVYVCTMESDPQLCHKRNIHNRNLNDIEVITSRFFTTPAHHIQLDATTLLQSAAITDVHMEDADDEVVMEDAQEPEPDSMVPVSRSALQTFPWKTTCS